MCSDHFAPWSPRQGESGFAWSWLGAALEATPLASLPSQPPRNDEDALEIAYDQWRSAIFGSPVGWELALPEEFDEAARYVRPQDVSQHVHVSADPARHAEWLSGLAELGFEEIHLHHVGRSQREFIEVFGNRVLPSLREGAPSGASA